MGQRAFGQERALAKGTCSLVAPTVTDQRYITPGLLFEAPGILLGGEVQDLGEVPRPVGVLGHRHPQDVRRFPGQDLLLVTPEAGHALPVVDVALDNLHIAGQVRAAIPEETHLGGVVEGNLAEMPGGLPPPGAVLGPIAAATSLGLGGEVHHHDAPAVLGDSGHGA
jgi:hypothetical protein